MLVRVLSRNARIRPVTSHLRGLRIEQGQEVELEVASVGYGGASVCKLEPDGLVVLVPRAAPQSRVVAKITKCHKSFAEGQIVRQIDGGPHEARPECKFHGVCSGCWFQHVEYLQQTLQKHAQLVDLIRRIAHEQKKDLVSAMIPHPQPYGSRKSMRFAMQLIPGVNPSLVEDSLVAPKFNQMQGYTRIGLHKIHSKGVDEAWDLVEEIDQCSVQGPTANGILKALRQAINSDYRADKALMRHIKQVTIRVAHRIGVKDESLPTLVCFETSLQPAAHAKRCRSLLATIKPLLQRHPNITSVVSCSAAPEDADGARGATAADTSLEREYIVLHGRGYIEDEVPRLSSLLHSASSPASLVPVSSAPMLIRVSSQQVLAASGHDHVMIWDALCRAGPFKGTDTVLHLFAGDGFLSLLVAQLVANVIGLEKSGESVSTAVENAQSNRVRNAQFLQCDLDVKEIRHRRGGGSRRGPKNPPLPIPSNLPDATCILIGAPPSHALASPVMHWVATHSTATTLVYVSHTPPLLSRDIARLVEWGWSLEQVVPVDTLPHTPFFAVVCVLRKEKQQPSS